MLITHLGTQAEEVLGCFRYEVTVNLEIEVTQVGRQLHVAARREDGARRVVSGEGSWWGEDE